MLATMPMTTKPQIDALTKFGKRTRSTLTIMEPYSKRYDGPIANKKAMNMTSHTILEVRQAVFNTIVQFAKEHNGATPSKRRCWQMMLARGYDMTYQGFRRHFKQLEKFGFLGYKDSVIIVLESQWNSPWQSFLSRLPDGDFVPFKVVKDARFDLKRDYSKIFIQVGQRDGFKCAKCGRIIHLEIDHIIPVSRGGMSALENLQLLCSRCNLDKGSDKTDYRNEPSIQKELL